MVVLGFPNFLCFLVFLWFFFVFQSVHCFLVGLFYVFLHVLLDFFVGVVKVCLCFFWVLDKMTLEKAKRCIWAWSWALVVSVCSVFRFSNVFKVFHCVFRVLSECFLVFLHCFLGFDCLLKCSWVVLNGFILLLVFWWWVFNVVRARGLVPGSYPLTLNGPRRHRPTTHGSVEIGLGQSRFAEQPVINVSRQHHQACSADPFSSDISGLLSFDREKAMPLHVWNSRIAFFMTRDVSSTSTSKCLDPT